MTAAISNFDALGLNPAILQALTEAGYTSATPVQMQTIPLAMAGRDLMVSSQTGSGKTAAFMLPALHRLAALPPQPAGKTPNQQRQAAESRGQRPRYQPAQPKMLVLAPTRELALQVNAATQKYAGHLSSMRAAAILGGMPYPKQMQLLARNPQILVATPGRLIDHMESGKIDFSQLEILVLDEADRMLDMGFIEDIEKIVAATPDTRQTMLFSATLDGLVGQVARRITRTPEIISVVGATARHENILQRLHFVDDLAHKNRLLDYLLRDAEIDQCVVFTATKRDADAVAERLNLAGFAAAALHGDMQQGMRNRTLASLRSGQVRILVATDVAARGIDVPGISHVVNFDLPKSPEDYVHRIGRTGRAGRNGLAISLANHAEGFNVRNIERFTKQRIPVEVVAGYEPKRTAPAPSSKPRKFSDWNAKPGGRSGAPRQSTDRYGNDRPAGDRYGKPGGYAGKPAHAGKPAYGGKPAGAGRTHSVARKPAGGPRQNTFGNS